MKSNLNLLFQNQDFKNSLRSSNTRNSNSFTNETSDSTKSKPVSKISKSVTKLEIAKPPKNQLKRTPTSVRSNPKFTDSNASKKPSFSQIYKNYVKPTAEKIPFNDSLFSPQLLAVKEPGIGLVERSVLGLSARSHKRESLPVGKAEASQSSYSFAKFAESRDKFLCLVDPHFVQFEFDEIDLFEFLICLRENVPL